MKMANEELPEYLIDSKTLENATWRLAVGLYQAQIKYNENKSVDKQLNLFSLEIINKDDEILGVITATDLKTDLRLASSHITAIEELVISNYKPVSGDIFVSPWSFGKGGLDTFYHLLLQLALLQVSSKYNPNSNDFIAVSITQSTTLQNTPFFVSGTITLPMENVLDAKEFICTPKEVITGESPWKITTP